VRVTGTAFDVRSLHAGNLAVTVAEGSVEIRLGENDRRSATAPIRLQSRDQLTLQDGQPQLRKLSESQLNRELAWREGQLALDNAPLHDVLDRFAHFHGTGISASPEVADLALSGQFTLTELDDFLLILETVHPVRVLRDQSGTIRVVSRD
jgi:transmembrane sensor